MEVPKKSEKTSKLQEDAPEFYEAVKDIVLLIPDLRRSSRAGFSDEDAPWDPWQEVYSEYSGLVTSIQTGSRPEWQEVIDFLNGDIEQTITLSNFGEREPILELGIHTRDFCEFFPMLTFLYATTSPPVITHTLASLEIVAPSSYQRESQKLSSSG